MRGILQSGIMKTITLYNRAEKNGIEIDRRNLEKVRSFSLDMNGKCFVALAQNVTAAEERVCLAHELGHCETMSFYNFYSPLDVRGKHERKANIWAIKKRVPLTSYKKALRKGYRDIASLAEHFDVTFDFMKRATEYYGAIQI